jgi:hypothetical protein
MRKPNITKGEWILTVQGEVKSTNDCSKDGGIDTIARTFAGFNIDTNQEAINNSKLLASAPDLAEALNRLVDRLQENDLISAMPFSYNKAKQALVKAGYTE